MRTKCVLIVSRVKWHDELFCYLTWKSYFNFTVINQMPVPCHFEGSVLIVWYGHTTWGTDIMRWHKKYCKHYDEHQSAEAHSNNNNNNDDTKKRLQNFSKLSINISTYIEWFDEKKNRSTQLSVKYDMHKICVRAWMSSLKKTMPSSSKGYFVLLNYL